MNSTNRLIVGAAVLSLVATAGITALTQAAAPTDGEAGRGQQFQAVREAMENNDYAAWAESMANHPNSEEFVNEETFATLQEAHELMEAGDRDGAKALLEEAGVKPFGDGPGRGHGGEHGEGNFEAVREAVESGDYAAWAEAMADHPHAEEFVNEETFATLQEAHALKEAGDEEGAKALLEEAGLPMMGNHKGGERMEGVREAVEAGDYSAWAEAMANHPNADEIVNEETFAKIQEAHELMEAGDKEAAKALLEEAGLGHPKGGRM